MRECDSLLKTNERRSRKGQSNSKAFIYAFILVFSENVDPMNSLTGSMCQTKFQPTDFSPCASLLVIIVPVH